MEGNLIPTSSTTVVTNSENEAAVAEPVSVLECFICMEPPTDPVSTSCGHLFCWPCIHKWLQHGSKPCPVCRLLLSLHLDVIPLSGAGSGASAARPQLSNPENGGDDIPPRPRNPLLVTATTPGFENSHGVTAEVVVDGISMLNAYEQAFRNKLIAVRVEQEHVINVSTEISDLVRAVDNWLPANTVLEREIEDLHWFIFLLRTEKMRIHGRREGLEHSNSMLVQEAGENRVRERWLIERANLVGEQIATLIELLNQANQQYVPVPATKGL